MRKWTLVSLGIAVICYMALIYHVSSISNVKVPVNIGRHSDKVAHFGEYLVLSAMLVVVFSAKFSRRVAILGAVIFASTFGVFDEIHQSFVPNRDSSYLDMLADCCGSICGAFLGSLGFAYVQKPSVDEEREEKN